MNLFVLKYFSMVKKVELYSNDPIIERLHFRPYRIIEERRVKQFLPKPDEPQTMEIITPWGGYLTATPGDYLISEIDSPNDCWPIDSRIFEESYEIIRPGYCVKRATVDLIPLVDLTDGDEDQMVIVHTLEGTEVARAGDFFLARGIKGELWCYPKEKVFKKMKPA